MSMLVEFAANNSGTILNLVGTVFIAISFGPHPDEGAPYTVDRSGNKTYIAYFTHPRLFWVGLVVVFVGFVLQLHF